MRMSEILNESEYDLEYKDALDNVLFSLLGDRIFSIETSKLLQMLNAQGYNTSVNALINLVRNNQQLFPIVKDIDSRTLTLNSTQDPVSSDREYAKKKVSSMADKAVDKEI